MNYRSHERFWLRLSANYRNTGRNTYQRPVVRSWVSPRLMSSSLFQFQYMSVPFKTSETKTTVDPDKIK